MPRKKEEDILEEKDLSFDADSDAEAIAEQARGDIDEPLPAEDVVGEEAARMTADVPVQLVAVLGKKTVSVKELIGLKLGQVLDLARPVNEMVDLIAGGKLVAKGELVDIDGKLGVKVVKMVR